MSGVLGANNITQAARTEEEDVEETPPKFAVINCWRKTEAGSGGNLPVLLNNNERSQSRIKGDEKAAEAGRGGTRRGGRVFTGDERRLITGSWGEAQVSEVRQYNKERIHKQLGAKTKWLFFPSPSLVLPLIPHTRPPPPTLFHSHAEGFALCRPVQLQKYKSYRFTSYSGFGENIFA